MCSTGSSTPGGVEWPPPQAAAHSAAARIAAVEPVTSRARELSAHPIMELSYDVLLGHHHAARVRPCLQAPLIELAHLGVFRHDEVGEVHHIAQVEAGIGQGLRREQI